MAGWQDTAQASASAWESVDATTADPCPGSDAAPTPAGAPARPARVSDSLPPAASPISAPAAARQPEHPP
jgi:hypothetical protein